MGTPGELKGRPDARVEKSVEIQPSVSGEEHRSGTGCASVYK